LAKTTVRRNRNCEATFNVQAVTIHNAVKNALKMAKLSPEKLAMAKSEIKNYLRDSEKKMEQDRANTRRQITAKGSELDKLLTSIVEASTNGSPKMIVERLNQKFMEVSKEREGLEKLLEKMNDQDNCIEQRIMQMIDMLQNLDAAWSVGDGKARNQIIKNTLEPGFYYEKDMDVLNFRFVALFSGFLDLVSAKSNDGGQYATLIEQFVALALDKIKVI
jgi:tRNA nucleotidyltransferase/poly(A) polymerase